MKLTYHRNGDYLLPNIAVNETDQQSLGKYGMLRLHFLETHRSVLYSELLLSGKLVPHLHGCFASRSFVPSGPISRTIFWEFC